MFYWNLSQMSMVCARVSPGIFRISRHKEIMHSVRESLTSGKWRVQYVSLHIITSSLREVIPKIQNKFNYSCIVDCHEIFQSLIFYQPLKGAEMDPCCERKKSRNKPSWPRHKYIFLSWMIYNVKTLNVKTAQTYYFQNN